MAIRALAECKKKLFFVRKLYLPSLMPGHTTAREREIIGTRLYATSKICMHT